jgi:hypothetical protein
LEIVPENLDPQKGFFAGFFFFWGSGMGGLVNLWRQFFFSFFLFFLVGE